MSTVIDEQAPAVHHRLTSCTGLRDGISVTVEGDDLVLVDEGRTTRLRGIPPVLREHLAGGRGEPRAEVREAAGRLLARMAHLTSTRLEWDAHEVMRHESTTRARDYAPATLATGDVLRLDRFALLRSRAGALVLECPRSTHRFVLTSDLARALAADLGTPRTVGELAAASGCPDVAREVLSHWAGAGLVEAAGPDGAFDTDTDPVLRMWDFHDLLMHSRSRSGRFDDPLGALNPYRGAVEPLPAVVPPRADARRVQDLPRPARWSGGLSLAEAVDRRRSIRDYAAEPVTVEELGAFLHRTFRDRARFDPPVGSPEPPRVSRPYPSGGGAYEHELYLTVRRCVGVEPGIYHYDALGHRLELVNDAPEAAREMLAVAGAATGHPASPDVLVTLTARFQRMAWRYRSIAYANVLRTTGAIYQTMYLVATDLDLAPCALGNGDADLAAHVLGLDYLRESSVGDFALGRRDPGDVVEGSPLPGWTVLDGPA